MNDVMNPEKATFAKVDTSENRTRERIPVLFNPLSLQLSISNTLEEPRRGGQGRGDTTQFVTKSSAKLTMDLTFDTTHDGSDVRIHTEKLAAFMIPDPQGIPAIVVFEWGTFVFQGLVESYRETVDFFAPAGVPLRASVNMTLARQERVFTADGRNEANDQDPDVTLHPDLDLARNNLSSNPSGAAREVAAANNIENIRFSSGSIALPAGISLSPPVAFASGKVGVEFGAVGGIGLEISGRGEITAGAGFSNGVAAGLSAEFTVGISTGASFGGSASARISASAGAFAGLRASTRSRSTLTRFKTTRTVGRESAGLATDRGAGFQVGGKATITGSAGLSADVGATASLKGRIQFLEG